MRAYVLRCCFTLSLLLSPFAHAGSADGCEERRNRLDTLDRQIAELEIAVELRERKRELEDLLRAIEESTGDAAGRADGAASAIGGAADNSDEIAARVRSLLESVGGDSERLKQFLQNTQAGTEQLRDRLQQANRAVTTARGLLQSSIDAGDALTARQSLDAFRTYFQTLNGILGPLVESVPVLGQFLQLYGEALASASAIAGQIDDVRQRQADLSREVLGRDVIRFTDNDRLELDRLRAERDTLADEIDEDCEDEEEDQTPAVPEDDGPDDAAIERCKARTGASDDYEAEFRRTRRELEELEQRSASFERRLRDATDLASRLETQLNELRAEVPNALRRYQQAVANATRVHGNEPNIPPANLDQALNFCRGQYTVQDSIAKPGTTLKGLVVVRMLCDEAQRARAYENAVPAAEQELEAARAALEAVRAQKAEHDAAVAEARTAADAARRVKDAMDECLEEQEEQVSDLNGVWESGPQRNEHYLLVQRGRSIVLSRGRDGSGPVVMRATLRSQVGNASPLENAQYRVEFDAGTRARCGISEYWSPYRAQVQFYDTQIFGRYDHVFVNDECVVEIVDHTPEIVLPFFREEDENR